MIMERLESLKEQLLSCVEGQMGDLCNVDAHELGEAVDMIKDLEEAMYYCSIVKAMEEKSEVEGVSARYYTMPYYFYPKRDMDKSHGKMYYGGDHWYEREIPLTDAREGKSSRARRGYMEAKELHKDSTKELEKYMQELSEDIVDMIKDASNEERQMLHHKMSELTNKIA